jgi:hypothetical protein
MALIEEHGIMGITTHEIASTLLNAGPRRRIDDAVADSLDPRYLRRWIIRRAVGHRELLRNIAAASRIGLAPACCGPRS